jgi:hypothetical protein
VNLPLFQFLCFSCMMHGALSRKRGLGLVHSSIVIYNEIVIIKICIERYEGLHFFGLITDMHQRNLTPVCKTEL